MLRDAHEPFHVLRDARLRDARLVRRKTQQHHYWFKEQKQIMLEDRGVLLESTVGISGHFFSLRLDFQKK